MQFYDSLMPLYSFFKGGVDDVEKMLTGFSEVTFLANEPTDYKCLPASFSSCGKDLLETVINPLTVHKQSMCDHSSHGIHVYNLSEVTPKVKYYDTLDLFQAHFRLSVERSIKTVKGHPPELVYQSYIFCHDNHLMYSDHIASIVHVTTKITRSTNDSRNEVYSMFNMKAIYYGISPVACVNSFMFGVFITACQKQIPKLAEAVSLSPLSLTENKKTVDADETVSNQIPIAVPLTPSTFFVNTSVDRAGPEFSQKKNTEERQHKYTSAYSVTSSTSKQCTSCSNECEDDDDCSFLTDGDFGGYWKCNLCRSRNISYVSGPFTTNINK